MTPIERIRKALGGNEIMRFGTKGALVQALELALPVLENAAKNKGKHEPPEHEYCGNEDDAYSLGMDRAYWDAGIKAEEALSQIANLLDPR